MDIKAMMKQAQKLQQEIKEKQEKISEQEFTYESPQIKVVANGKKEILSISINEAIINKEDKEMLEDLILVAVNNALSEVDKVIEKELGMYTRFM